MGYQTKRSRVTRVDLGDGYWADVLHLSFGQVQHAQLLIVSNVDATALEDAAKTGARPQIALSAMDQEAAARYVLATCLVNWNLDDEDDDGRILPLEAAPEVLVFADQRAILRAACQGTPIYDQLSLATDEERKAQQQQGTAGAAAPLADFTPPPSPSSPAPVDGAPVLAGPWTLTSSAR